MMQMLRQRKRPRQEIERGVQQCRMVPGKRETRYSMDNNKGKNENRKRMMERQLKEKTRKTKAQSAEAMIGNGVTAEVGTSILGFHLHHCKVQ